MPVLNDPATWNLWKAYAIFYVVGTALAVNIPVVGWMPFQSLEQMGPLFVLAIMQLYAYVETRKKAMSERDFKAFCKQMAGLGVVGVAVALGVVMQSGRVGGLSARVRGRGLHSSTFQLNLSRFGHTYPRPPV